MVRQPGDVKIGGVDFIRPPRETGLLALNGQHVAESHRGHVALPGGGWLQWIRGSGDAALPRRPTGGVYTPCLSPFDAHPDACTVSADFDVIRAPSPGLRVLGTTPDPRDRSYSPRIDRRIEDVVTGEFIESSAPGRIETDDGQSGLDDYLGHLTPCPRGDIRSCDCCRCPADDCGIKSIRHRKNKTPTYACNSEDCNAEFEEPALRPARKESEPTGD